MKKTQSTITETYDAQLINVRTKDVLFSTSGERTFPIDVDGVDHPAKLMRVALMGGITKNMGDFESLRINVSLDVPCAPGEAELEAAYEFTKGWIGEKINDLSEEAVSNM